MKKGKFKFLKFLNEYRSIESELHYVQAVLSDAHLEFEVFYKIWCVENDVDLEELNKKNQRKVDMIFVESQSHKIKQDISLRTFKEEKHTESKSLKDVYKAVAKKLHPDALRMDDPRRAEYEEDFKRASVANDEGKWGELFDIVDRHGVSFKEYEEAIECLRFDIKRIKAELEKEKSTYSWLHHEAESDQQRENVIKRFLGHLFGWKG
jgi:uncharacterized small protein (DUF1192 family)|tara:strand:+ start:5251 stop:5874 length:624 start_codon:yes stop_codon:yes gene_type:complete